MQILPLEVIKHGQNDRGQKRKITIDRRTDLLSKIRSKSQNQAIGVHHGRGHYDFSFHHLHNKRSTIF